MSEAKTSEEYQGDLGDTATQLAWMAYADAEEIENHSYLAGTHEMCVWIDGLTKRLREEGK